MIPLFRGLFVYTEFSESTTESKISVKYLLLSFFELYNTLLNEFGLAYDFGVLFYTRPAFIHLTGLKLK